MRSKCESVKVRKWAVATLSLFPTFALSAALSAQMVTVQVAGHELQVPRGFAVDVYAAQTPDARLMALGPDGVPYLAETGEGRVVKLPDANHDGKADSVIVVASGLTNPHGLAFLGDTLFIAEGNRLVKLVPGHAEPQVVIRDLPCCGGHFTRSVVIGPDRKLYVSAGSSCNICDERDRRRAAVTRYNLDGSGMEIFATGLRNSVGLAFYPGSHELWATNNDRDNLGDDVPPDRINILKQGRFYGWPQCWLPGRANPEYRSADCSRVEPPALTFQAHAAPLGIAFYTGTAFPAEYRGDVFFAEHGSWNRSVPVGYQVMHAHVRGAHPLPPAEPFVTGFRPAGQEAWERPVGLLVLPDGSVLVSCDSPGMVLRVHWVGR